MVEVVVAVGVFSIGALGIFALSSAVLRLNDFGTHVTGAGIVGENTIENLLSQGTAVAASGTNIVSEYTCTWAAVSNTSLNLKTVDITTVWQLYDRPQQHATLRTVLYPQ